MANVKNEVAERSPREIALLESVADLMARVPDAGGDVVSMLEPILTAQSASDLIGDDSGGADDIEDHYGHLIRIDRISKAESDFQDQPGSISNMFLICNGYDLDTNRDVVFAIGAAMPIAKLLKLQEFGAFPAVVRFDKASKATARGYFPINMSVIKVSEPVNA